MGIDTEAILCGQPGCAEAAVIWFRIGVGESPSCLVAEFDLRLASLPSPGAWRRLCGPHLNGALVAVEDEVWKGVRYPQRGV